MPIERSIDARCPDPYATRRRADRGLTVPCPTGCLAYQPETDRGCLFVNLRVKLRPRPPLDPTIVSPLRGERVGRAMPQQQDLWVLPTPDMMVEPGPTGDPEKEST